MKKFLVWVVILIGLMSPVSSVGATTNSETEVVKKYVGNETIELGSPYAKEPFVSFENGKLNLLTNDVRRFIVLPKDTSSAAFKAQMLKMTELAYSNKLKPGDSGGSGWTLVEFKSYSASSLQVALFKKKVTGTKKYYYCFAFRGTKEFLDVVTDLTTVINNTGGLQVTTAEKYVKDILKRDAKLIQNAYYTGHSLGGYLAAWVQSEVTEGNIKSYNSSAVTFNAPGLSPNVIPRNLVLLGLKWKVAKKITKDKLGNFENTILNLRISGDPISAFGDKMGVVKTYNPAKKYKNPLEYHKLVRFYSIKL